MDVVSERFRDPPVMTVRAAGEILRSNMIVEGGQVPDEFIAAFKVANEFRDAHTFPMRSVRRHVYVCMQRCRIVGITGARLKRMPAIRRKLKRSSVTLDKLQDLAGCRIILPTIADVRNFGEALVECLRHEKWKENDYIQGPKDDGYRSHHLMFKFRDQWRRETYEGRRVEIQVRTQLQHSWATAVEAVGLFRGEYLKGSQGDQDWLRLLLLMSAEFCLAEGCPEPAGVPEHVARSAEIIALNEKLGADITLASMASAVQWRTEAVQSRDAPAYYLIRYDAKAREVRVEPHSESRATVLYFEAESVDRQQGNEGNDVVLVHADKIETLKAAYPNYFGDVTLFRQALQEVVQGRSLTDFDIKRQEKVRVPPPEKIDAGWLYRGKRLWVEPTRSKRARKKRTKR